MESSQHGSASRGLSLALAADERDDRKAKSVRSKVVLIKYHVDNALRAGVTPAVYSELIKALRLVDEIDD